MKGHDGHDGPLPGDGRSLAEPAFPDDDGSADPQVRALLDQVLTGAITSVAVARALRDRRLLVSVVAVLDAVDDSGGDKDSHMAVVSMVNAQGEAGLLAFTGVDSLREWDVQARPVPARGRDVARAARDDGALAVVLDVVGPARVVLEGSALEVLADEVDLAVVEPAVLAALAPLTADGWVDVRVLDGRGVNAEVDVLVELAVVGGGHPDGRRIEDLLQQAARTLAARPAIQRMVPGGLGVTSR